MPTATLSGAARHSTRRRILLAWIVSLSLALLGALWLIPDGPTYWQCVLRHAWRLGTFRDARFAWRQRVEQRVTHWQEDVFLKLADSGDRVAALQAAAYVLGRPHLAAEGADPVVTLLDDGSTHGQFGIRFADRWHQGRVWLDEARRLAPDDPVVIWQQAAMNSWRARGVYSEALARSLVEQGARADEQNAFWDYLLATMPRDDGLFRPPPPKPEGARVDTTPPPDPVATRRVELQQVFKRVGLDWSLVLSPMIPLELRNPSQFAAAAERASRRAAYRHPQAEANRRIERAARGLGLPAWSRAKLRAWLSEEFPAGEEFWLRYRNRVYQPTSLYGYAEVSLLRDAVAAKDRQAAQASYRRLLGLFRHLWDTYTSDAQREAARDELLKPCLALLKEPLVQQSGCFPTAFANQVRREFQPFVDWRSANAAGSSTGALPTGALAPGPTGPTPALRAWLILADSVARAGLALAIVAGLLWAMARWVRQRRGPQSAAVVVHPARARAVAWAAPCLLLAGLAGLEGVLALLGTYAATSTPSQGTEQFVFIAWSLACSTAAAIMATFRRSRDVAMPANVGVLAFVLVLLGSYYATRLFGLHLPSGAVMIPWSNVAHVLLDPTRGRSYYEYLEGREIALVLAPLALASAVVALNAFWQLWRTRRKAAVDARSDRTTTPAAADESGHAERPATPHWARRALVAGVASLVLCSSISVVMGLGVWIKLPAVETEEAALRAMRDYTGGPRRRAVSGAALVAQAPVDLSLRLRNARGFWQYVAGSLLLAVVLFTVAAPPDPAEPRLSWPARLSIWPPARCVALRRCLTATLGWLAVFGATLHVIGFAAAGYWIRQAL